MNRKRNLSPVDAHEDHVSVWRRVSNHTAKLKQRFGIARPVGGNLVNAPYLPFDCRIEDRLSIGRPRRMPALRQTGRNAAFDIVDANVPPIVVELVRGERDEASIRRDRRLPETTFRDS